MATNKARFPEQEVPMSASDTVDELFQTFTGEEDDGDAAFKTLSELDQLADECDTDVNKLSAQAEAYIQEAREAQERIRKNRTQRMEADKVGGPPPNGELVSGDPPQERVGLLRRAARRVFGGRKAQQAEK